MGVCLCKSKTTDDLPDNISQSVPASGEMTRTYGQYCGRYEEMLSETVDRLVKETLKVISTLVDNEPEPPASMVQLHGITDKPVGWIQLVKSLIRIVPLEHPMGPSVITLLLDDSPLPTKDSVIEVADMISHSMRRTPRRERNLCVILGCLAEKLAGPSSIAVLSEATLGYLIGNLVNFLYQFCSLILFLLSFFCVNFQDFEYFVISEGKFIAGRRHLSGSNAILNNRIGKVRTKK